MKPHIIIEGPDRTGKTTLSKELEKQGWIYRHEGPPPPGVDIYYYYLSKVLEVEDNKPVVFDRLFLGEAVYGPILRNTFKFSYPHLTLLHRVCKARGFKILICLPPLMSTIQRWQKNVVNELVQDEKTFERIYHKYEHLIPFTDYTMAWTKLPRHIYDEVVSLPKSYVGDPGGKILFVGEQAGAGQFDLPFMGVNGVSAYLNDCLAKAGYRREQFAMTNAFLRNNSPNTILQFQQVVAFGDKAATLCQSQGIKGRKIPHPSYFKRFHFHETQKYIEILRRILNENYS